MVIGVVDLKKLWLRPIAVVVVVFPFLLVVSPLESRPAIPLLDILWIANKRSHHLTHRWLQSTLRIAAKGEKRTRKKHVGLVSDTRNNKSTGQIM